MRRLSYIWVALSVLLLGSAVAAAAPQIVGDITAQVGERLGWEITFRTNGPGMSYVEWGEDATYGQRTEDIVSLDTNHRHVIHGLLPATTYHFRVVVYDWQGNIVHSDDRTFTTPELAPPTNFGAYGVLDRALLGWNGSFGAAEYRIYRSNQPGGPYELIGTTTDTNYIDEGLTEGESYYYVVAAVSALGEEQRSVEVDATPHPLANHVVGAWLIGECEGDFIRDYSAYGNHGRFVNPSWAEGRFDCAAQIQPGQNYIVIPTMNGFDQLTTEMTISVWFYVNEPPNGNHRVIQSGTPGGPYGVYDDHFRLLFEFGEFKFQAHPDEVITRDQTEAVVPGQWQHVAAVYSGDLLQIYVNGKLYAEQNANSSVIGSATEGDQLVLYIGTKYPQAPHGDWWNGLLDEIAVFDKALRQEEVELVMHGLSALF